MRSGALAPAPVPQDEHDRHDLFARGVDLFEQNYLWEAHEVWEAAWRAAPVSSVEREALGTLIQLAAAVLTSHLGRRCASDDLVARVRERLAALGGRGPEWRGLSWASLGASVDRFAAGGPWPSLAPWLPELRVVGGVLARSGRVLGAQRPGGDSLAGRWEIPGGKVEEGESDTQALERELGEELGVRVLAGRRLAEVVYPYPARRVRLLALECRLEAGEPRPLHHRGLRWFGPGELGEVRWAPADVPLLDALAAAASASEG